MVTVYSYPANPSNLLQAKHVTSYYCYNYYYYYYYYYNWGKCTFRNWLVTRFLEFWNRFSIPKPTHTAWDTTHAASVRARGEMRGWRSPSLPFWWLTAVSWLLCDSRQPAPSLLSPARPHCTQWKSGASGRSHSVSPLVPATADMNTQGVGRPEAQTANP